MIYSNHLSVSKNNKELTTGENEKRKKDQGQSRTYQLSNNLE